MDWSFLSNPQFQLGLAQFGSALSPRGIAGGKEYQTFGERLGTQIIPVIQGNISQQKAGAVESGAAGTMTAAGALGAVGKLLNPQTQTPQNPVASGNVGEPGQLIPGKKIESPIQPKASDALGFDLGGIPGSALSSEHVTGVSTKDADGKTITVKSPGPKDYMEAQIIRDQQTSGQPASSYLGSEQSPYRPTNPQESAGAPGASNIPPQNEAQFQQWYKEQAAKTGLNPNPDDPAHRYNYRAAYAAGVTGPGSDGHWPSQFKSPDHPNRFVNGVDTITGQPAGAHLLPTVLRLESGGKDYKADGTPLTSPKGALYAMQVMPDTAARPGYGVTPARNNSPEEYNRVGREYLSAMYTKYGGDNTKALAAYNAGPEAVDQAIAKYGNNYLSALPEETQIYVANAGAGGGGGAIPNAATGKPIYAQAPANLGTTQPVASDYQPPVIRPSSFLNRTYTPGLTPEQVQAATDTGLKAAGFPYDSALKAAQAKNIDVTAEATRLGLPAQAPVVFSMPNGQKVTVSGKEVLDFHKAMAGIISLDKYRTVEASKLGAQEAYFKAQAEEKKHYIDAAEAMSKSFKDAGLTFTLQGKPVDISVMAKADPKGFVEKFLGQIVRADASKEAAALKSSGSAPKDTINMLNRANTTMRQEYAPSGVLLEQNGQVNFEAMRAAQSELEKRAAAGDPRAVEILNTIKANDDHIMKLSKQVTGVPTVGVPTEAPALPATTEAPATQALPPGIPEGSTPVPGYHDPNHPGKTVYLTPSGKYVVPRR